MFNLTGTALTCGRSTTFAGLIRSILPALVLVCLLGSSALHAQDDKLPKGGAILDKYVEVTGGKAAYEKLTNRVTQATFEMVGQGLKFSMTIYAARPDKMYAVMESEAFGKIEKGTDGEVVWEMNVMTGPQIKEGEERALVLRGAAFDAVPQWRKLYKQVECVGVEAIDGKPCYKIVLTPKEGQPETRYYGKESNLLVKTELTLMLPAGTIPFESYASDYKRVDGILIPHKARVVVMGSERVMTVEGTKHNVEMPKDRFKLPEDIQALVDQRKSEKAEPKKP
ncbi:MAG TPA: hypothetical protein VM487_24625 [Phycisphaerae bacterium]|nr:hypothetical protein [Phycisphaerae bacterium]